MNHRFTIPITIFIASLAFYIATLAPTVEWGDFGGYQTRVTIGELELAPQGHPLWNLLSRPFPLLPFGDAAFRVNLSSAFFAALALVVLYVGLLRLTQSQNASVLAVLALAVSHTFWTYAVVPKAYSLTMLMLALCILLLHQWRDPSTAHFSRSGQARWHVLAVGGLLGLGVMNHLIILTALPGLLLFIWWHSRRRIGDTLAFAVAFVVGLLPYVYLLRNAPTQSATTGGFITSSLMKFIELLASPSELLVGVGLTIANLGYQFLLLTLVGVWGWWQLFRADRSFAVMILLIFLGDVAFVLIPTEPPVMMHWHLYHPAYLAFAYPLAFGIAALLQRWGTDRRHPLAWAAAIVAPALLVYFALAPMIARALNLTERLGVRDLPGRDTITFLFTPSKAGDYSARRFGEAALDGLPPNAALYADWTPYAALWYLQAVEGRRRDVLLLELPIDGAMVSAIDRQVAAGRVVYLADGSRYYNPQEIATKYRLVPEGIVYRVVAN